MRLRIDLVWHGGILEDNVPRPPPEPIYELYVYDAAGRPLPGPTFDNCLELEACIARHHAGCEREALPPAGPEDAARLARVLALLEQPGEKNFNPLYFRATLAGMLYQWSHAPATVARIRRELGLPPALAEPG